MPYSSPARKPHVPTNNTVKLTAKLRERIEKAMEAEGFAVWSEFCRVALTEKCSAAERKLMTKDPGEYIRTHGKMSRSPKGDGDGSDGD